MKEKFLKLWNNKTVRILFICIAALFLLLAVWKVFFGGDSASPYSQSEEEKRLCRLLESVEGVNGATVMITEEGGCAVSAVIVFNGADSLLTRMRVIDITASALNLAKGNILVYPAKG